MVVVVVGGGGAIQLLVQAGAAVLLSSSPLVHQNICMSDIADKVGSLALRVRSLVEVSAGDTRSWNVRAMGQLSDFYVEQVLPELVDGNM